MGVIRYFRYDNVSEIVIIDPQHLFDKITELIVKTFTFDKGAQQDELRAKHKDKYSEEQLRMWAHLQMKKHSSFDEPPNKRF